MVKVPAVGGVAIPAPVGPAPVTKAPGARFAAVPRRPLLVAEVAVARFATVMLKLPLMAVESAVAVATVGTVLVEIFALIAVDRSRFCTLPWNVISWLEMDW